MVALFIFFTLVAFLLIVLLTPIRLFLRVEEDILVECKYLFWRVILHPRNKEMPVKQKQSDDNNAIRKMIQAKGTLGAIQEILEILKNIFSPLKALLHRIKFSKLDLFILVANDDAATTAIEYGAVCGVVYPLIAALEATCGISKRQLRVQSDFDGNQSRLRCNAVAQIRPIFLLSFVFTFFKSYLKQKTKDGAQYGRKQH